MPPRSSITEKDIIVAYNNLQGITKVSESLHVDYRRVKRALINNGIPVKCHRTRKHSVNHSAFSELTPDACYWIGMLFADGYIYHPKDREHLEIHISLGKVDKEHLMKLINFTQSTYAVGNHYVPYTKIIKAYRTKIISNQIANDLMKYGMCKDKLAREAHPSLAQSRDFWRGMIDGDGCISIAHFKNGNPFYPVVDLTAGLPLLKQFLVFVKTITPTTVNPHKTCSDRLYRTHINGSHAIKLLPILYHESSMFLNRKHNKALDIINTF